MDTQDAHAVWPPWVAPVVAALALGLAALTPFVHHQGERRVGVFLVLGVAAIPWGLILAGVRLPLLPFALGAMSPIAILNWWGAPLGLDPQHDAQLSLMLLALTVGYLSIRASPSAALALTGFALLVPVGRRMLVPTFEPWIFWAVGGAIAGAAGAALSRQHRLVCELRRAQAQLSQEAARGERQRIAREVHDVIAHSLTVTMLHLTAARMALRRSPQEAEEAIVEAERLGRQALADIRRTVGLLRTDDDRSSLSALPDGGDVQTLVSDYEAAGVRVRFRSTTDLDALTPTQGLVVYRTVQEGLANASRYAAGATVDVLIEDTGDGLRIRVSDDGGARTSPAAAGGGLGLAGMRERVEAVGGTITTGPTTTGWEVTCTLPVGADA
jgi:signal transduction histidine kinase